MGIYPDPEKSDLIKLLATPERLENAENIILELGIPAGGRFYVIDRLMRKTGEFLIRGDTFVLLAFFCGYS